MFLVISGYFSYQPKVIPSRWILKRIKQIMIPYWIVISIVLVVNTIVNYKETNILKNFIVFFGGSLFVDDPVYVISWFITYILLLYLCVCIFTLFRSPYIKLLYLIFCGALFFLYKIGNLYYYIGFFLGYFVRYFYSTKKIENLRIKKFDRINIFLYQIQNYSYSFFLIHAGVLHLFINLMTLSGMAAFSLSIFVTSALSVCHKKNS